MYKNRGCHFIGYPSPQVSINSICVTLEAGVGHRTIPMLLAKSSFHGDVKNWSTLINLHSLLNLEVKHASTDVYTAHDLISDGPLKDRVDRHSSERCSFTLCVVFRF